jgi:hypothetical protein
MLDKTTIHEALMDYLHPKESYDADYAAIRRLVTAGSAGVEISGLGNVVHLDSYLGAVDQGNSTWMVVKVEGQDTMYRITGYYSSYGEDSWRHTGSIEEVTQVEKTIFVYEAVS